MSRPASIIELSNVSFRAGEHPILRDINWSVRPGEHWALLGRNGSGKTTLLRIIAGYVWPQSGSVRVMGDLYGEADIPTLRKRIGWVTSFLKRQIRGRWTALDVALSGFEASVGVYRDFEEPEIQAARETMGNLGCAHLEDQSFETLSQGERQRVLLARGIVHKPDLLILDEPCSGLDPLATREFLKDLEALIAREDSPTLIYVTHHLEELAPFVQRVLLLKQGTILVAGETQSTLTDANLSETFGAACRVGINNGRFHLLWE